MFPLLERRSLEISELNTCESLLVQGITVLLFVYIILLGAYAAAASYDIPYSASFSDAFQYYLSL